MGATVSFDASSEFPTGTTPDTSTSSFSWTHTPSGTPAGVLVYVFTFANANDSTSVTYGGTSLTAVSGGYAVDTAGEPGSCRAWYLGSSVPSGSQTVQVSRNNSGNGMYAVCITVTCTANTMVYTPGIVLQQTDNNLAEQAPGDGGDTGRSLFAGIYSGRNSTVGTGANSTALQSLWTATQGAITFRETTRGGSTLVGANQIQSDDIAAVYLAVVEYVAPASLPKDLVNGLGIIPIYRA